MPFFSKVFRSKDATARKQAKENGALAPAPPKPRWDDAWQRQEIEPEEVQELLRGCTVEIRSRGLDLPFLLLPFRPASDPSAARSFIRNYFGNGIDPNNKLKGERLVQELRLVEPLVLCSVLKWCWSRLAGGVVTWEAYELFKIGEQDSNSARDAFATFIPISVASDARTKIIFDFFELLAAIAAHGKSNGLGGLKLSRFAGWWAFEHLDAGKGFDVGYKSWERAADAASHLLFAYLRSLSPDSVQGKNGISALPLSLQHLLETTEYPPNSLIKRQTSKVVMIVESVSPTPFALLRRTKNFEYRDDDAVLQRFSNYDDPVKALTDECRRVLKSISSTNDSSTSKASTSLKDPSWSRFEDIGFGGLGEDSDDEGLNISSLGATRQQAPAFGTSRSRPNLGGRPTTPSWADFLSSGFVDDSKQNGPALLLPPDKVLPPINTRGQSSQSHKRMTDQDSSLEPGELANITTLSLDETFWWVWITSLSGEEPLQRKAVFGRCALIETRIYNGAWLLIEEIIKGAAPEPDANTYVAEKKSRFGFSKRGKLSRSKSSAKGTLVRSDVAGRVDIPQQPSKTSIAPDQHARIQAAAAALQQKHQREDEQTSPRRARRGEESAAKTSSVLTLQPVIMSEAAPAMKWANSYDKNTIRTRYLGDNFAGKGSSTDPPSGSSSVKRETSPKGLANHAQPRAGPSSSQRQIELMSNGQERLKQASEHPLPPTPKNERTALEQAPSVYPVTPPPRNDAELYAQGPASTDEYPRPMQRQSGPPQPPVKDSVSNAPDASNSAPKGSIAPLGADGSTLISSPSPESVKHDRNKLKKKAPPNTFKGLFNRMKGEEQNKPAPKPAYSSSGSSSAVAAAKAALEAKAAQQHSSPPPPQPKVTNKRFSTVGNRGVVEEPASSTAPSSKAAPSPQTAMYEERPTSTVDGADYAGSYDSVVDPQDAKQAEREFRTFDQGPLEDNPAFAPEDSPPESVAHSEPRAIASQDIGTESRDDVSIVNEPAAEPSQTTDRWAQIRKNAAERAARMSEEQSRQTDRTDDGDTSGEETIESRVARIKARVAELTGNMEDPGASRAHP